MLRSLLALVVLIQGVLPQPQALPPSDKATGGPRVQRLSQPLPFKPGESLTYEVSFSKLILSGTIGELKLWVARQDARDEGAPGHRLIELRAEAISKGFFSKLFGVKVRDRFTSLVNSADFGTHTFTKNIEEGKVRREQKSVIDRSSGRVTYTDRDLANNALKPKVREAASPTWIQDVLSVIYYVRTSDLKQGNVIPLPISDGGDTYNIEVVVIGKPEEIKVAAGKFKTVQLDVRIFDGRYIKRSGEMKLWVTDDSRRIPIRARVKTSGATVTISLKQLQEIETAGRP